MNEVGYKQWREDVYKSLLVRYIHEEVLVILNWFDSISREKEVELIGEKRVNLITDLFFKDKDGVSIPFDDEFYTCLMGRAWLYAPLILKLKNG